MKIGKKMEKSINAQIQAEFESSYLYLSMAAWFEGADLPGCAHWMEKQAEEEWEHGMKFYKYLVSRGGRAILGPIAAPKKEWKDAAEVFEEVLAHEEKVTSLIYAMVELAEKEKDHGTRSMLNWFVDEQVEEEEHATEILARLKNSGNSPIACQMLDRDLGSR